MVVANLRTSRIEISKQALANNIAVTMQTSHAKHMFLAVKANGYGHGLLTMAQAAVELGVYGLAVAVVDEGLALRQAGITIPIMILGYTEPQYAEILVQNNLIVNVVSLDWLNQAQGFLTGVAPLQASLAVDSGMNRLGMRNETEVLESIDFMSNHRNLFNWVGIMTHFATADSSDVAYFNKQLHRFNVIIKQLPYLPEMIHVANSGAAVYHADEVPTDYIRVGTVVYGWEPSGMELADGKNLKPAMNIKSALSYVKQLPSGEGISYSHIYETTENEWIGTVPLGYGDGIDRELTGYKILVGHEWCPIIGKIAMDQLMVKLPYQMPVGTEVTILGSNGSENIDIWDVAHYCHLEPWEFTNRLTERLPRILVD
ncbi:alanine racemase [Periweissella beninensis]|uniref:alanine racemase n=1 Tax=Periweissella beninensis TaxID=504936 RepID=UPI0021A7D8EF|nr:alanine racemase [Periweissella beninensis]MCT4396199.1 alanine racemase [Periweissella beninensis]